MPTRIPHKYCSLSHQKIKTLDRGSTDCPGLLGCLAHCLRRQRTPNANRLGRIYIACKETNWQLVVRDAHNPLHDRIFNPNFWVRNFKSLLAGKGISQWRKNAVLLVEQLAHFSPEIFRGGDLLGEIDHELELKVLGDTLAFQIAEYGELLLVFVGHCDEQTVHAHSYIVPLELKAVKPAGRSKRGSKGASRVPVQKWVLSAKTSFYPDECSDLQTRFAAFMCNHGYDMHRGIKGSRAEHQILAGQRKLVHSPIPKVPSFVLSPELTEPASTALSPQEYIRLVKEQADSWRREIEETIIPPLHARALEHQGAVQRCEGYQETARVKENENDLYREKISLLEKDLEAELLRSGKLAEELRSLSWIPSLDGVARRLLGRDRCQRMSEASTVCQLPDGKSLQIDSNTGGYSRERVGRNPKETIFASGTGVIDMITEVMGWNINHTLAWIESQWGLQGLTACLAQISAHEVAPLSPAGVSIPATADLGPVGFQLVTREQLTWESVKKVLVSRFKFTPDFVDGLAANGTLGSNGFGDLLVFTRGDTVPKVYPLMNGAAMGDGIFPAKHSFIVGTGKEILVVAEDPLEAMALWEFIPKDLQFAVSIAVADEHRDLMVWEELVELFPQAKLFNALPRNSSTPNRGDLQGYFSLPPTLAHGRFPTWVAAWRRRFDNPEFAEEFRKVQSGVIEELRTLPPPGMAGPLV